MSKDDRTPETREVEKESKEEEVKEDPQESPEDKSDEPTLNSLQNSEEKNKIPDSIPYSRFKEVNDESKAKDALITELQEKLESLDSKPTKADAAEGLSEIAKEYNLDEEALGRVAKSIEAAALAKVQETVEPLTKAQKESQANHAFEKMYTSALENHPQYKDIANKEVIRQLAFNPANANKTFSQLLKDVYGSVAGKSQGSKTMETTQKGRTETIEKIDYKRASSDSEYFKQIMADPKLKAEYNSKVVEDVSSLM